MSAERRKKRIHCQKNRRKIINYDTQLLILIKNNYDSFFSALKGILQVHGATETNFEAFYRAIRFLKIYLQEILYMLILKQKTYILWTPTFYPCLELKSTPLQFNSTKSSIPYCSSPHRGKQFIQKSNTFWSKHRRGWKQKKQTR